MKIEPTAMCKSCRKDKAVAQQATLPCGFIVEYYFCQTCNDTKPNYKPRIMEVYRPGQ